MLFKAACRQWWWLCSCQGAVCDVCRSKRCSGNKDTEDFVTARGTQSAWRIGWSFYAGAVGSWVIVTPSQVGVAMGQVLTVCDTQQPWARLVLEGLTQL